MEYHLRAGYLAAPAFCNQYWDIVPVYAYRSQSIGYFEYKPHGPRNPVLKRNMTFVATITSKYTFSTGYGEFTIQFLILYHRVRYSQHTRHTPLNVGRVLYLVDPYILFTNIIQIVSLSMMLSRSTWGWSIPNRNKSKWRSLCISIGIQYVHWHNLYGYLDNDTLYPWLSYDYVSGRAVIDTA